ncbi:MAG: winged helix DNA-binding domain-containing protein [Chloroflexi bacterium]|nr:winged helix DNA-binding domain-containing protein [Chloroflexota bacterium]MCY3937929.1 winged helix DNA-binding domain-containing protein [Chloroflexota bacterium]
MAIILSDQEIRWLRLRAQRLYPKPAGPSQSVAEAVGALCAVQAQYPPAAALALRPRASGFVAADVERARLRERSVMRTWCMRGTLHLLATEDVSWLLALHGPVFAAAGRRRRRQVGLDDESSAKGLEALGEILSGGKPKTRAEIACLLKRRDILTKGQAVYHLLRLAGLERVVCFGPDLDGEPTYVLFEDWVPSGSQARPEQPQAELARRYLSAHGPAGPDDLAAWSGLRKTSVRTAWNQIEDDLIEVRTDTSSFSMLQSQLPWLKKTPPDDRVVHLLPAYDPYLLGYRKRELAVPARHARRIHPGGGLLRPVMLVDGVAHATWKTQRMKDGLGLVVEPFEKLTEAVERALEAEFADLERYLEVPDQATPRRPRLNPVSTVPMRPSRTTSRPRPQPPEPLVSSRCRAGSG